MTAHRPNMITLPVGNKTQATCLTCGESSPASTHRLLVKQWVEAHKAEATTVTPNRPRASS